MVEVTLAEIVARLRLPGACACQAWTGLETCTCNQAEALPLVSPPSGAAKRALRVENLAQVLYQRSTRGLHLLDRPKPPPWSDVDAAAQRHWRNEAKLMLMRNGVL